MVQLDPATALAAARISAETKLPLADSVILATARAHDAVLWTQDADFEAVPGVKYWAKRQSEGRTRLHLVTGTPVRPRAA